MIKSILSMLIASICLLVALPAFAGQYTDDPNNCGKAGYVCKGGRICQHSHCLPDWQLISSTNQPTSKSGTASAVLNGKMIITGGCDVNGNISSATSIYDPTTDTWSVGPNLNVGRARHTTLATPAGMIVYGGVTTCNDPTSATNSVELLTTALIPLLQPLVPWQNLTSTLPKISDSSLTLVSGNTGDNTSSYPMKFDLTLKAWSPWVPTSSTQAQFAPFFNGDINAISEPVRFVDTGDRIFMLNTDLTMITYERSTDGWANDGFSSQSAPTDLCNEASPVWINGEIFQFGGMCNGNLSNVGAKFQPYRIF